RLLERLPDILAAYRTLLPADRGRAEAVLATLTQAMLDALRRFPPEDTGLEALETPAELDRYTYMNAGCVGAFWTDLVVAHRRAPSRAPAAPGLRPAPPDRARHAGAAPPDGAPPRSRHHHQGSPPGGTTSPRVGARPRALRPRARGLCRTPAGRSAARRRAAP